MLLAEFGGEGAREVRNVIEVARKIENQRPPDGGYQKWQWE